MAYTLNDNLKRWAEQYETAEFIQSDPVQIPHRYDSRVNIEISAFVTAWIAWGSRKQIIQKADFIDREIFKGEPYHYIVGNNVEPGAAPEWKQYKGSKENFYRTFTYADFHDLCARLFDVYSKFENMEKALQAQPGGRPLEQLQRLFGDVKGVPDMETKSGCKRLCMFLRWMCRHGSPVDFGLWTICDPRNLIIPLDTHVHKQALRLGLVKRRTPDLQTAIEITDRFAEIFPDDPTKGDFALFGYGVNNGKVAPVTTEPEPEKEQPTAVADLSIADVLKMRLFYDNAAAEVREIWESREKARKALKATERLKAHPIDGLHNAGLLELGEFVVTFAKVLDKRETKLSRAERDVIRTIGMTAFNKTMQKLIADEKARNNSNGGLAMYMGELNEFFKGWKGSRIIARFTVASPGSSEALKGYYFNYVVPTFKHAIWEAGERLTEEQTERRLREFSPIMYVERVNEETGVYSHDLRTVADLSNAELIEHIETLKQIAAEEYNTFIDDPKTL